MKFFEKQFILKSINEMGKVWNDAFLTCLCIHKELHLKDDSAKESWHQINKDSLKNYLAYYFDLHEKELPTQNNASKDYLSIIFAQNYESQIQQVEICYLAALCFRKQGIPENINDAQSLKDHIIKEFCLPPHFQTRLKNTLTSFPNFVNQSTNDDVVETLLDESGKGKDKAETLSLCPKKVLGDSAGNLGAAYFQTIYSKMNSQICLVTSIPNQYPIKNDTTELIEQYEGKDDKKTFKPAQIIYYGVPGSGKSHQIQEDLKKKGITEENHQQKRVVFHPDYCNADFVGQIVPVTKRDGGIRYQFKAGPFTKILRDAYENPDKEYALIIEEINRGNAAAIFGDLFQLLDRKKENDPIETVNGNSYGPGWSDYCIENDYINAYFRGAYDTDDVPNPLPPKTLGNITFNDNVDIRLPPNFSIYATMNTSDQNVYTLDNAFQRRWEMKQISDELKNTGDTAAQYSRTIKKVKKTERGEESVDTNVQWGDFRKAINDVIMDPAQTNGLSSMDDKRLGGWFYTESDNFAEKVLKYLWDDAFKFDRPNQFDGVATLEKLVEKFNGDDGFNVFKDERISKLQKDSSTSPGDSAQKDNANLNG